jgi:c(7)-type cytochrome triheme protein
MKSRALLIVLLLIVLPTSLYARWITDQVVYPVDATGPTAFSHFNHLDAVGQNCPSCHNSIFHIVAAKNPTFSMKEMKQGKSCGACHNGRRAFSVNDCSSCHPTRKVVFETDAGPAPFDHDVHTGMYGCGECHPSIFKAAAGKNFRTMAEMEKGASCGACHDGGTAFTVAENCDSCHEM